MYVFSSQTDKALIIGSGKAIVSNPGEDSTLEAAKANAGNMFCKPITDALRPLLILTNETNCAGLRVCVRTCVHVCTRGNHTEY